MRMIVRGSTIEVDLIHTVEEIGELTKLGVQFGYTIMVDRSPEENVEGHRIQYLRDSPKTWGETELVNLAILFGFVYNKSGDQVLETMRSDFAKRHFPLDKPIQDVMSIGAGPDHEGHDHD